LTAAGCPFFPLATWSNAQTRVGWTAGAGVEWAFADNWTAKLEYLYVDLGHSSTTFPNPRGMRRQRPR
jgi:outer membrane immunogenic protein